MLNPWVVIQQGGSSGEFYAASYETLADALLGIAKHEEASYTAIGPYPLKGEFDDEQLFSVHEAMELAAAHATDINSMFAAGELAQQHRDDLSKVDSN